MKKETLVQIGSAALIIVALFRFFLAPSRSFAPKEEPFIVRVRIAHDEGSIDLEAPPGCELKNAATGEVLDKVSSLSPAVKALPADGGVKIGGKIFRSEIVRLSPDSRGGRGGRERDLISLNGTLYRGDIDIIRTSDGLDAINVLPLEDYLKGVLPREINPLWPFAVMKAQAIASRSFAVAEALRRKNAPYDLTADTFSQVYGGRSCERWRATRAVEATGGMVLEYGGEVFPAYFFSCCGGHTEDIAKVWGREMEPLKGVKCSWCRWSPYFRWKVRVPTGTIHEKLNRSGFAMGRVDDIREGPRDRSGRLEYLSVRSRNRWLEIPTDDFRYAIGGYVLKSAKFHVKKYPRFYLFSGYGWGHGVGMCQWGAFGLALRRWSAERILEYYYPGTKIVALSKIK